jgi:hypothetical protein
MGRIEALRVSMLRRNGLRERGWGWDRERKRCAETMRALSVDCSTMRLDDLFHNRETETGALLLRISSELVEDFGKHVERYAGTIVAHQTCDRAVGGAGADNHPAAQRT